MWKTGTLSESIIFLYNLCGLRKGTIASQNIPNAINIPEGPEKKRQKSTKLNIMDHLMLESKNFSIIYRWYKLGNKLSACFT